MKAHYLLRFDDVCPRMDWAVWERIEPTLDEFGIKPVVAVVPDNQDPKLEVNTPRDDFWQQVRRWQAAGWCIALHGYQHRYVTRDAGLLGINAYSEFAGLPEDVQRDKLVHALAIFKANGVRADAWVAPAHSFDVTTVKVLLELGLDTISDGFFFRPVRYMGARWIPQQLWHFRPMPAGLWTVCVHCNGYADNEIARLKQWIREYAAAMTTVSEVLQRYPWPTAGWLDRGFASWLPIMRSIRRRTRAG